MFHVEHFWRLVFFLGASQSVVRSWMFHVEQSGFLENRHTMQDFSPFQASGFHFGITPADPVRLRGFAHDQNSSWG
jgi:hypothetical protein